MRVVYFDNAATGGKKTNSVINEAVRALLYPANPQRGAHSAALAAGKEVYECRRIISKTFNNERIERVIFTPSCTEALNCAIFGLQNNYATEKEKNEIVADVTCHNSVLRPLYALKKRGYKILFATPSNGKFIAEKDVLSLVGEKTRFVCLNAASNVTGYVNDYPAIGRKLKEKNVPLILDGAQAGGHIEIDMKRDGISCLCLAAHKGLGGIQGAGVLLFDESVEISPLVLGGTGTESFSPLPSCYPELLEAGTMNLAAIKALKRAIIDLYESFSYSRLKIRNLTEYAVSSLKKLSGVRLYSEPNDVGIISFSLSNAPSAEVADALNEYGVAVRAGFHCAPLIHEFLRTKENGLVRISFSRFNELAEIDYFIASLCEISRKL